MSQESQSYDYTPKDWADQNLNIVRILLDESTDPIFCFEKDGTYRYINWAFARPFGKTPADIIGKRIWDVFSQEEADRRFAVVKKVFETGKIETIEVRVPQPSPKQDLFFLTSVKPVFAADGQVEMVICSSKEITERKRAEDALRASEAKLRQLTDMAPVAVAWSNSDQQMEYINQAFTRLFGYELADIPTLEDWFTKSYPSDPEVQQRIRAGWQAAMQKPENERPLVNQVKIICKDGSTRMVLVSSALINGYAYAMFVDITEKHEAEEKILHMNEELEERVQARTTQLERANRELESFSYSVSHDLRAPLRSIDGFTSILMEDYYSGLPLEGQHVCRVILKNTRRMSQLIDDLLAFSRLSRTEMRRVPVDMRGLADLAYDEMTTPEIRQRIEFKIGPIPGIQGDPSLMRQVWLNLISNAIKFSSRCEKAVIEVGAMTEVDETIYYIRDNGAGFDMQYAGKLFGVFQRLHNVNDFEGTGVGLAIVQRVVQRHNGRCWAEGKIDQGAVFYFALPAR